MSIQVLGLEKLRAQFSELSDRSQREVLRNSLRSAARPVVTEAKRLVQVDRGDLKKAIKSALSVKSGGEAQALIGFEKDKFYGRFVELGTSKMPAEPFLRPALINKQEEVVKIIAQALAAQIARIAAKGK